MSAFAVTVEKIERVWEHPNADRLALASVHGLAYQFCIRKGEYSPGDVVVYLPIDSLLPDWIVDRLGIRNFLAGKDKNRIKTVKLRGQISQGLVCKPEVLLDDRTAMGQDLTERLGVTKYEPPDVFTSGGMLRPLPAGVEMYDIESADRFLQIVEALMDQPVLITEKLEGTNHSVLRLPDGRIGVCQRGYEITEIPGQENTYWRVAREQGVIPFVEQLGSQFPDRLVAIRSELIGPGIQKNIYGLKHACLRCFDVKVGFGYVDVEQWMGMLPDEWKVPVLSIGKTLREWLQGRTVQDASNGKSVLMDRLREGIVIKPMREQDITLDDGTLHRLIIKQRSPEFLAREED